MIPSSDSSGGPSLLGAPAGAAAATLAGSTLYLFRQYRKNHLPSAGPERPQLVLDAIENGKPIYYFGVGSNLSRKKLENRAICGKKIHIISMEPCVIPDHRLAFNMRAFPPLEPAMGGLEPLGVKVGEDEEDGGDGKGRKLGRSESKPLRAYENEECHGALICLSAEDYERVYKSEGGGVGSGQGYEEIIVTCVPYDSTKEPVQAVAYRAREHVRLAQDPCPSRRYMSIIREGAKELGLKPCYQKWLADHPVQHPSWILKKIAINNCMIMMPLAFVIKWRFPGFVQSTLLFKVYVLPTAPKWKQIAGEIAACAILLPGACVGFMFGGLLEVAGLFPPMLKKWVKNLEG